MLGKMLKLNKKGGSFFMNYMLFFLMGMCGWITIMTSVSLSDRSMNKQLIRVVRSVGDEADESIIYEDNEDYDDDYDDHEEEGSLKKKLFRHGDHGDSKSYGNRRKNVPPYKNAILPYPIRENPFPENTDSMIHILLTLDQKMLVGLPTLINSVLSTAKMPVRFHIMWCAENSVMVQQYMSCFDIKGFKPDDLDVADNVGKYMNAMFWKYLRLTGTIHKKLESCADLVRLQSHRIFPYLDKVLWLDVDMIAQGDVSELWEVSLQDRWLIVARTENQVKEKWMRTYGEVVGRNPTAAEAFNTYFKRYNQSLNKEDEIFNNGVSLLNLKKWRKRDAYLQQEYEFWMEEAARLAAKLEEKPDKRIPWWFVGNQAIMWFVFQEDVGVFPFPGWHCDGLGWRLREKVSWTVAQNAKLLHWNGDDKPWLDSMGRHLPFWYRHRPVECQSAGKCTFTNRTTEVNTLWSCVSYADLVQKPEVNSFKRIAAYFGLS